MKRILYAFLIIFVSSFFCGIGSAASAGDSDAGVKWEDATLQTSLEKAQKENKLVLIDFYSPT